MGSEKFLHHETMHWPRYHDCLPTYALFYFQPKAMRLACVPADGYDVDRVMTDMPHVQLRIVRLKQVVSVLIGTEIAVKWCKRRIF